MRLAVRDLFPPLLAVVLTLLGGLLGIAAAGTSTPLAVALLTLAGAAGAGVVLSWAAGRSARIARVNVEARRLLSPEHRSPLEAAATLGRPESDETDDDVSRLRQTLSQLGMRMSAQVKENAKKTRNLESLLDTMQDPLVATDAQDEVLLTNAAMEAFAGAPRATLIGRPIRGLFTRAEVLDVHARAKEGSPAAARVAMTTEQGPRVYDVRARPLPAAWGQGVFGVLLVLRDITELAQSVQVQRDFVANASHELRTPIAAIRMAAETLESGAADDLPMRQRLLRTIADHVDRLEETIRDLMDLSRSEAPALTANFEPVDLSACIERLRPTFEPLMAQRGLSLSIEIDPQARALASDPRLLSLILRNLIDNATKYAKPHTTVRVAALRLPSGDTRIDVTDRGCGIPLAHQERVWERFYQVDPARTGVTSRRGTGLGLAIVKQAAEALGGRVGLDSIWGEGTTVWVELPLPQADQP